MIKLYPNLPEVDAITNAPKVRMFPIVKWANPTSLAWTIESATGLSLQPTRLAIGVRWWAQTNVSINSCQYPHHDIKNMNPVAHTRWPNKNIQAHTESELTPKGL